MTPSRWTTLPFRDRQIGVLAGVFALALIIRVFMLAGALHTNPMLTNPQNDAHVYWEMAGRIAEGHLVNDAPFLSVPLYPYFLGLVRALGGGLTAVYVLQLAMHLASAGLIGLLAGRKMGYAAGLVATIVFLLLQEPAFFAFRLLPSALQLLLVSAALLAADRYCRRAGKTAAALLGLLTGLLTLVYPPAMILVPLLIPWAWWVQGRARSPGVARGLPEGWRCGLIAAFVAAVAIAPATVHNYAACGEFIPVSAHACITFRQGNAPGAIGVYVALDGVSRRRDLMHRDAARVYAIATGRPGSYREVDRFFFRRGLDFLTSDPRQTACLVANKAYRFLTGRHYYDYDHLSLEQVDGLLPYGMLAPLPTAWLMGPALMGVFMLRRRARLNAIDAAMLLLPLLIVAAFWYSPRYRLPAVPLLAVASAVALVAVYRNARSGGSWWRTAGLLALLAILSIATGPLNNITGFDYKERYRPQFETGMGHACGAAGRYEAALEHFLRARELCPEDPGVWVDLVDVYLKLQRLDQARQVCDQALAANPDSTGAWLSLGKLEMTLERWAEADAAFARCLELDPHNPDAHAGRWWTLTRLGKREEGTPHLLEAVRLDPFNPLTAGGYGIFLAEQGRLAEAEKQLRRATQLAPDAPEVYYNLAVVLRQRGRPGEAVGYLRAALELDPTYDRAQQELDTLFATATTSTERIARLRARIAEDPSNAAWYSELAGVLYVQDDMAGAVAVLRQAVDRADDANTATVELAWLLATCADDKVRNGTEAVRLMGGVLDNLRAPPPEFIDVYAAALAETGRFEEAIEQAEKAKRAAQAAGNEELANLIGQRVKLYQTRKAHRQ